MYNRNSRGPRIEPWGTPQRMRLVSEFTLLMTVNVATKWPTFCCNFLLQQRRPRNYRFNANLLNCTDEELRARYRFGKESIQYITNLIEIDLRRKTNRSHALRPIDQVLTALRFYASVEKSTVSRAVHDVSQLLSAKQSMFIKWPTTAAVINENKNGFYRRRRFPGIIGCIDGTQIRIIAPSKNESDFVACWPGSTHDSHVFHTSPLCTYLETNNHSLDYGILLRDSGYACTPYLITPYPSPSTAAQENYNTAHTKTRGIVEQSFGSWKRRFHVLHSEIRMTPQRACSVIGACGVLHNIAVLLNEPMDDDPLDDDPEGNDPYHGPTERACNAKPHL